MTQLNKILYKNLLIENKLFELTTFDHKVHENYHLQLDIIEKIDFQSRTKVLFGT